MFITLTIVDTGTYGLPQVLVNTDNITHVTETTTLDTFVHLTSGNALVVKEGIKNIMTHLRGR